MRRAKLETREDCFIPRIRFIEIVESYICIVNQGTPPVYYFDTTGKFISNIGTQGKYPDEYIDFHHFAVTKNADSMFVLHAAVQGRLLFYHFNSGFQKGIPMKGLPLSIRYIS